MNNKFIDDQTLIDIALSSDEPVEMKPTDDIATFIFEMGIGGGNAKILNHIIFDMYVAWKKTGKPMDRIQFFKEFGHRFERGKFGSGQRFYYLDPTPFDSLGGKNQDGKEKKE